MKLKPKREYKELGDKEGGSSESQKTRESGDKEGGSSRSRELKSREKRKVKAPKVKILGVDKQGS